MVVFESLLVYSIFLWSFKRDLNCLEEEKLHHNLIVIIAKNDHQKTSSQFVKDPPKKISIIQQHTFMLIFPSNSYILNRNNV